LEVQGENPGSGGFRLKIGDDVGERAQLGGRIRVKNLYRNVRRVDVEVT
jgi:hypothetical protein